MQNILLFMQNHMALSAALVAISLLLIILEFIKLRRGTQQLTPAEAVQLFNHQNAAIIDLRSSDLFSSGHIVDSVSIPLSDLTKQPQKADKFKSRPIVLVCATGQESQRAATILNAQGLNAQILAGGIQAWRTADMPLIKGR